MGKGNYYPKIKFFFCSLLKLYLQTTALTHSTAGLNKHVTSC